MGIATNVLAGCGEKGFFVGKLNYVVDAVIGSKSMCVSKIMRRCKKFQHWRSSNYGEVCLVCAACTEGCIHAAHRSAAVQGLGGMLF